MVKIDDEMEETKNKLPESPDIPIEESIYLLSTRLALFILYPPDTSSKIHSWRLVSVAMARNGPVVPQESPLESQGGAVK